MSTGKSGRKGNPQVRFRLPPDHWILSFTSRERNETVRKALDFYRQFSDELQALKEAACEMWELLLSGAVGTGETVHQFVVTLLEGLPVEEREPRRGLKIINRETDRLTGLVEKLLDFSRLAAGELTLRLSLVDLVRLVQDCRTDAPMGGAAGNRFADHYKRIKDHFPPVEADADRLKQVLVNLLDNALKFTPAGGKSSWPWND